MFTSRKPKVGLLLLGHRDYSNDVGLGMANKLTRGMGAKGLEVLFEKQALTDHAAARGGALKLLGEDLTAVVVLMGTWTSPEVALAGLVELHPSD